jgi:hypothetical protein
MRKIILMSIITIFIGFLVYAGPGHDHGDSAFINNSGNWTEIEFSEHQIKNLRMNTSLVRRHDFYETIKVSMILNQVQGSRATAQGFLLEGKDILKVKPGMRVTVKLDIMPNRILSGRISYIDNMIDPRTRLYYIYAAIHTPVPSNGLGLRGEMVVQTTPLKSALGVPIEALQGEFGDFFVFVKCGNHFERRQVVIGHRMGDVIEIKEGLTRGEEVVTTGAYQLRFASGTIIQDDDCSGDHHH